MKAYQAAVRKAKTLAKRCGPGWEPWVWENLGWHFCAVRNQSRLYPQRARDYWCSLMLAGMQFQGFGKSPEEAIKEAEKSARERFEALQKGLQAWGMKL